VPRLALPPRVARWMPAAVVLATLLFALVVQSAGFARSSWMMADLAYHRGVAYTMQGGDVQGQGPYAGLLTYYGGLYPLFLAFAGLVSHSSFDEIVTVVSWVATLIWPLALIALGWRLFPRRPWAIAAMVVIGTVAAPLTRSRDVQWVDSVLPSGSSFWPIFPRDIAIVLLVLAVLALLSERRIVRILVVGGLLGLTLLFHAQLGLLGAWFATAWTAWRAIRERDWRRLGEPIAMAIVAAAITAWWVLPRGLAAVMSGSLILADLPTRGILRLDPIGFVLDFGALGLLGLLAIAMVRRPTTAPLAREVGLAWVVAFAPFVVVDRLWTGIDLFSERRIWLLIGIGFPILATVALLDVARWIDERPRRVRVPGAAVAAGLVAALVASSIPATAATVRMARDQWKEGSVAGERVDVVAWGAAMAALRDRVTTGSHPVVATYDGIAAWVWSFSGASVADTWLPGFIKLGFDPGRVAGVGQLERNQLLTDGFDRGLPGICSLRSPLRADTFLLETRDGLLGTFAHSFGAAYRVAPKDRDVASTNRVVGDGLGYVDIGTFDALKVTAGTTITVPWSSRRIRRVDLVVRTPTGPLDDVLVVRAGGQRLKLLGTVRNGPTVRYSYAATGVQPGLEIKALRTASLVRAVGFQPETWPNIPPNGYAVVQAETVCPAAVP
jgi:hypothetical protein